MVARNIDGVSEIHQFAAMNIAFAISSAIGTIVGGQMYDHVPNGWAATIWFCFGMAVVVIPFLFFFAGNRSLYQRLLHIRKKKGEDVEMEEAKGISKRDYTG